MQDNDSRLQKVFVDPAVTLPQLVCETHKNRRFVDRVQISEDAVIADIVPFSDKAGAPTGRALARS